MTTALTIPPSDREFYAQLPDAAKREITAWSSIVENIMTARRRGFTIGAVIADEAAKHSHCKGFSAASIQRKYDLYRLTGDWRVFYNHSRYRMENERLPPAFIEHWRALCEKYQRKCKPAWRELIRNWQSGRSIPGYRKSPPAELNDLPKGWSYRNLMRHKPTKFELSARRLGRGKAARYRPLVFTTRKDLHVGQFYLFDDLEHDMKVNLLGVSRKAMRPLELSSIDLFSGCKVAWGMKPCLENELTEKKAKN